MDMNSMFNLSGEDDEEPSHPSVRKRGKRVKVRVLPTANIMRRVASVNQGKDDLHSITRPPGRTTVPVVARVHRSQSSSSRSTSSISHRSWSRDRTQAEMKMSDEEKMILNAGKSGEAPTGMIPVPVKITDPRMLHWMSEFEEPEGPAAKSIRYVYRPTFLTYKADDDNDPSKIEDEGYRDEVRIGGQMSTYYDDVKTAVPYHSIMILLNSFSVYNSFYLLYKYSELGESYIFNRGKSPLENHRYLQFHILLAALISLLEVLRRSYDVPTLTWMLWSRRSVGALFHDLKANLDDLKSLLFLLYCTWSVPGLTYETLRWFKYDMRVASPFQAFFPLAFVSYAALAIVRPLRGLSYGSVSANFNVMWKVPVYVSAATLIVFYLIRGYAVPALIMFLHAVVLGFSSYSYFNVQVVNKFLVLLVQEKGFGIKILLASFLNWAYLKYIRGLMECFNLYEPEEFPFAVNKCSDTVSMNTFWHRLTIAMDNIAAPWNRRPQR